jgi:hypothetical protein
MLVPGDQVETLSFGHPVSAHHVLFESTPPAKAFGFPRLVQEFSNFQRVVFPTINFLIDLLIQTILVGVRDLLNRL